MKKLWLFLCLIVAAVLLVVGSNFLVLRNARGNEVVMSKPEYSDGGVLVQVFAGSEAPNANWVFLGSSDPAVGITLVAPPARGIYLGANTSSVRNDGEFEVRIHRRYLGILWLPDCTVRFDVPRDQMPKLTGADRDARYEAFRLRVTAQK